MTSILALLLLLFVQAPQDPLAALKAQLDTTATQMEADATGAAETLDHLAVDSLALRKVRALTAEERAVHARLFVLRARAHIQLLNNDKALDSLRELLRVDPAYAGELAPREQELFDSIRKTEGAVLEVQSTERGARVLVDGIEAGATGDTPVRMTVIAGTYEVRLEKPGFKAAVRRVAVAAGETVAVTDLVPERNVPPMVLLTDREGVQIVADNAPLGRSVGMAALRGQLSAAESAALDAIVAQSGLEAQTAFGVVLRQPAVDRPMTIRFQRDCFIEESRSVSVTSEMLLGLDPAAALLPPGAAGIARLRPDVGTLRVASTPADADVLIDGQLAGRTPFDRDVCSGARRVRVRHRIGSYEVSVNVTRGRTELVNVALKPDLAFLGAVEPAAGGMVPSATLTSTVERAIASIVTAFHLANRVTLPAELQPWTEASNAALVAAADAGAGDRIAALLKQASYTYDAPLLLVAARREGASPGTDLLFFWRDHTKVDRVRIADGSEAALAAGLKNLNEPAAAASLVFRPDAGFVAADVTLPDARLVVTTVRAGSPAATAGLKAGDAIETVDGNPLTAAQLASHVAGKNPGDIMNLRVAGTPPRPVAVAVQRRPVRAPSFDAAVPGNVLLARLVGQEHVSTGTERDLVIFGQALVHMRFGEWKAALDRLAAVGALPAGEGVGPAALLYFRARCHEALGEKDRALALYKEAMAAGAAETLADDGASVATVAGYRLALLARAGG